MMEEQWLSKSVLHFLEVIGTAREGNIDLHDLVDLSCEDVSKLELKAEALVE